MVKIKLLSHTYGQKNLEFLVSSISVVKKNHDPTPMLHTAKEMKFSIKDFFSKCDQVRRKLQIWSHLLKKSLKENFIFCAVPTTVLFFNLLSFFWRLSGDPNQIQIQTWANLTKCSLREKCPNMELFLVRIRENMEQKLLRIWTHCTQWLKLKIFFFVCADICVYVCIRVCACACVFVCKFASLCLMYVISKIRNVISRFRCWIDSNTVRKLKFYLQGSFSKCDHIIKLLNIKYSRALIYTLI